MTTPCSAKEIPEGQTVNIVNPNDSTPEAERQTTTATGNYSFKINLKNPLVGTNKTLYNGKFTVNKFHVGPNLPANKGQFDYYVEHDWLLPIGYLFWNMDPNEEAPQLKSLMWFRGELKAEQVAAYRYYNGKAISSTANAQQGSSYPSLSLITPSDAPDPRWTGFLFQFFKVAIINKITSANQYPDTFFLDKNPGDYDIKVLVKGQLARTTKFTSIGNRLNNNVPSDNVSEGTNYESDSEDKGLPLILRCYKWSLTTSLVKALSGLSHWTPYCFAMCAVDQGGKPARCPLSRPPLYLPIRPYILRTQP